MENRNYYPWFIKMSGALAIYFEYVRRINAIIIAREVPYKKRIADLDALLMNFSNDLNEAELSFLVCTQFPFEVKKCSNGKVEHNVMGMDFVYFKN
jgi:hypothetical protein